MPNPTLSYPYEKFMVAVNSLAVSHKPLRDRVYSAFLSFGPLMTSDFSKFPEIKAEFEKLKAALTRVEAKGEEGNVRATLDASSDDEVSQLASSIVDLFLQIVRERFA